MLGRGKRFGYSSHKGKIGLSQNVTFVINLGHIRPHYYKLLNLIKRGYNYFGMNRKTPRKEVDLSNKPRNTIRVEKSDIMHNYACFVASTDYSNNWYFDSGCSCHMTGQKNIS